jgi:hypothetical protein
MHHSGRRGDHWGRFSRLLGIVWALPMTLIGLAFAYLVGAAHGHVEWTEEAILARGPLADWLLSRHPLGAMQAMAIGHVVIARDEPLPTYVWRHEMEHVRQGARWGILFPIVYCLASLIAVLRGKHIYVDNAFEVAARRAEYR